MVLLVAACGDRGDPSGTTGGATSAPALDLARAERLVGEEKYADAAALLEKLAASAPRDSRPLALLGFADLQLHRHEAARVAFESLRMLAPSDARAEVGLSRALELLGRTDDAEAAMRRALALAPEDVDVLYGSGQLAARRTQDARAKDLLLRALAKEPWSDSAPAAHYALAGIATRSGDEATAARERGLYERTFDWTTRKTAFERRVATVPNDAPARRALAALWREARDGRRASEILAPLLAAFPRDARLRVEMAEARELAGDVAGALALDAEALRIDGALVAAFRHRASVHLATGKLADCAEALEAALDVDPAATSEPALRDIAKSLAAAAKAKGETAIAERASQAASRLGG
ncbi:MAG TPA: tetratricopeptide repeat protein [Planctomycetota bacterium]|nr:tetratricopeptide repeat protein [Planctomycetota bacterium]